MKTLNLIIVISCFAFTLGGNAARRRITKANLSRTRSIKEGPQAIPGKVQCAYYDLGGEGVAYHDTDAANNGNGVLNRQKYHQRPHATPYHWNFRANEGVDISYTKDFADFRPQSEPGESADQSILHWLG